MEERLILSEKRNQAADLKIQTFSQQRSEIGFPMLNVAPRSKLERGVQAARCSTLV